VEKAEDVDMLLTEIEFGLRQIAKLAALLADIEVYSKTLYFWAKVKDDRGRFAFSPDMLIQVRDELAALVLKCQLVPLFLDTRYITATLTRLEGIYESSKHYKFNP